MSEHGESEMERWRLKYVFNWFFMTFASNKLSELRSLHVFDFVFYARFLHFDMESRFTSLRVPTADEASRFSISRDRNLPLRFCSISITELRKSSQFLSRSNWTTFYLAAAEDLSTSRGLASRDSFCCSHFNVFIGNWTTNCQCPICW